MIQKLFILLLGIIFPIIVCAQNNNIYLYSDATGSYSMSTIGSKVTKSIEFYIQNNGDHSVDLTKCVIKKKSTDAIVSSTTNTSLLGILAPNDKKTLSFTINEDLSPYSFYYEWTYTFDDNTYIFDSRDSKNLVQTLSFDKSCVSVEIGQQKQLSVTIMPSNATVKTLRWESSDENIVEVHDGVVTGKSLGTTNVIAYTMDGTNISATCQVTVIDEIINVTSLTLSESSLNLVKGDTYNLTFSILPQDATNKTVTWNTSNPLVATIEDGLITAVGIGNAKVTASANDDSGLSATCDIIVTGGTTSINGYDFVDLGLPSGLLWATCNVGANSPEEIGGYYAWGETVTKSTYTKDNYKFTSSDVFTRGYTKYNVDLIASYKDNKTVLDANDDAAFVNLGQPWRMPSDSEFTELRTKCSWTRKNINGVDGFEIKGTNGNSIFLPIGGYYKNSSVYSSSYAKYWSRSLYVEPSSFGVSTQTNSDKVYDIENTSQGKEYRYYGLLIRPVVTAADVAGITEIETESNSTSVRKIIKNGAIYIIKDNKIYNTSGQIVK